jgi:hypothetical protein
MFHVQSKRIEALSQRFFDIGSELSATIKLYDSDLAITVNQLYSFKYSFLFFVADSLEERDKDGERSNLVAYKQPSTKVLDIDMYSYYEWVKQNSNQNIERNTADWTVRVL